MKSTQQTIPLGESDKSHDLYVEKLQGLRHRSTLRRPKLLDSKQRTIGADVACLKKQVEERKTRQAQEKQERKENEEEARAIRQAIVQQARVDYLVKASQTKKLCATWDQQQHKYTYSNDKGRAAVQYHDLPIDVAVNDPNTLCAYNVASEPAFCIGEDSDQLKKDAKQRQLDLQTALDSQLREQDERQRRCDRERSEEQRFVSQAYQAATFAETKNHSNEMFKLERIRNMNDHICEVKQTRLEARKKLDQNEEAEHRRTELASTLVTERRPLATEIISRCEWKGLLPAELTAIREEQRDQMKQKEANRAVDDMLQKRYAVDTKRLRNIETEHQVDIETRKTRHQYEIARFNKGKAKVDKQRYIENEDYRLRPGIKETYWPFGKSDR